MNHIERTETPQHLLDRLQPFFGRRKPISWRRVERGYTPAERWVVTLDDGSSAFIKAGANDWTAESLRAEYNVYSQLQAPFMARMLWWQDDPETPVLVLEDLSDAFWPPPWSDERVQAVLTTLEMVRRAPLNGFPTQERLAPDLNDQWGVVQREPAPFLGLGLASSDWLDACRPRLDAAAHAARLEGGDIIHFDVRSDNMCFVGDRVVLIDWNNACRANGKLDIAAWLPSLHAEGGPRPETILPDEPELAALVSGYFAAHAGLVRLPNAPNVRNIQLMQLKTALPWAVRALGLPPLDGPNAET